MENAPHEGPLHGFFFVLHIIFILTVLALAILIALFISTPILHNLPPTIIYPINTIGIPVVFALCLLLGIALLFMRNIGIQDSPLSEKKFLRWALGMGSLAIVVPLFFIVTPVIGDRLAPRGLAPLSSPPIPNSSLESNPSEHVRRVGDYEGSFLIQKINKDSVDGLWYAKYPVATNIGKSMTIHVGDNVDYACEGISDTLVGFDSTGQSVTFLVVRSTPPPGGCPL